jgi:hypothetical protein
MKRAATCSKETAKSFIVDVPASLLKRNAKLSRDARRLYLTMRGLANGKTGELAIRRCPLDWRYISRQAEMGRDAWQRAVRELIAAGFVVRKRERVTIYRGGRRRVVLGRALYFVHRQARAAKPAKTEKDSRILLIPGFSTVEESGTQISSETPRSERLGSDGFDFPVSGLRTGRAQSSSPANRPDDDGRALSDSKPNPFLTEEDTTIIRGVRENLARDHSELYRALKLEGVSDEWFAVAMNYLESRGYGKISAPIPYFTRAFVNTFANLASGVSVDETLLGCINAEYDRNQDLREKYGVKPQPLTPDQEERRRAFNAKIDCPPERFP